MTPRTRKSPATLVSTAWAFTAAFGVLTLPSIASAQMIIKEKNAHPDYRYELEPHGNFVFWHRSYGLRRDAYGGAGDVELGAGFRASIELGDPAFVPQINNTVAITFGIDMTNCTYCANDFTVFGPIGMQWNFYLNRKWSVFADLGFLPRTDGFVHDVYADFFSMVGGRYHFSDKASLTMRLGYPFVSVGVSFFGGR